MAKGKRVERPPEGVEFPLAEDGRRSTMGFNAGAFEASVAKVDAALAAEIRSVAPKWRKKYARYVVENVKVSSASTKNALTIAKAGLDYLHDHMVFVRNERSMPLRVAMNEFKQDTFATGVVKGRGKFGAGVNGFEVPYKGKVLSGDALLVQIDKWVHEGVIEVSCGHAMNEMVRNEGWLDLRDTYFVMLGASSAMGPFEFLMNHGANVVAVDIDRPHIWNKLIGIAEKSPGTLTFPLKQAAGGAKGAQLADIAGCNLLTQTPEIRNWLLTVHKGKPLGIGSYAYLDGALFVKLSMSMDAIAKDVIASRKNVSLAYLCTPTDCHIGTSAANAVANKTYRRSPAWQSFLTVLVSMIPGMKPLKRNAYKHVSDDSGNTYHIVDAIVHEQGPNYILAKRLQHWRAIVSRCEHGCIVSSNIAPSTRTLSVVHNITFKMAYGGMGKFRPMEVFDQETSSAVMAGLLVYDLKCENSASYPQTELGNPLCLFSENSFHGGAWRCGYKFSSIGTSSILVYLLCDMLVPLYLFLYNVVQLAGWAYVMYLAFDKNPAPALAQSPWPYVHKELRLFQNLAGMEVVHSMLKMTSTPWTTVLIQVLSRVLLVEGIVMVPAAQASPWIWGLVTAWGITEVVRYSFYALKILGKEMKLITWLRYSLFLVLYPFGVTSELAVIRPVVYGVPESWHVLPYGALGTLCLYWFVYVPFFPMLFGHMLAQRKKILGGGQKVKKE